MHVWCSWLSSPHFIRVSIIQFGKKKFDLNGTNSLNFREMQKKQKKSREKNNKGDMFPNNTTNYNFLTF